MSLEVKLKELVNEPDLNEILAILKDNYVEKKEVEILESKIANYSDYEEVEKKANNWETLAKTFNVETPQDLLEKAKSSSKSEFEKLENDYLEKEKLIEREYNQKVLEKENQIKELNEKLKKESLLNIAGRYNLLDNEYALYKFSNNYFVKDNKVYSKQNEELPISKEGRLLTEKEVFEDFVKSDTTLIKANINNSIGGSMPTEKSMTSPLKSIISQIVKGN